jgi:hypothetical protein
MSGDRIDFRAMTRNFLLGESDEDSVEAGTEPGLITEDVGSSINEQVKLIIREAQKKEFNRPELVRLIEQLSSIH